MKAVYGLLTGLGIAKDRIAYEFFGPASLLGEDVPASEVSEAVTEVVTAVAPDAGEGTQIVLGRSGRSIPWNDKAESLLSLLEDAGLKPEFSCRAGVCGTCVQGLVSGEVDYFEEPLDEPEAGQVLCAAAARKPRSCWIYKRIRSWTGGRKGRETRPFCICVRGCRMRCRLARAVWPQLRSCKRQCAGRWLSRRLA
ncbi:2Fe-2S iron-sulfur cluster-binding protein [Paracoccus cavernae]|uniref:2Fe-2S iron-sulfur cluster-binding protein n=1 Tax=Paracoccus cavernae TaxID=1571207 RepID=A0ABT8D7K0_9RHOB|nr:2Fe-2S iron-sulfur cluster-binding protein [Paracoccus cavernae]